MTGRGRDDQDRARDFIREVAGRVAFELASTPEGRAAGLSVEVWPTNRVVLNLRSGHELCLFVETGERSAEVGWERVDPGVDGTQPARTEGRIAPVQRLDADDVRAFMAQWLVRRTA